MTIWVVNSGFWVGRKTTMRGFLLCMPFSNNAEG